MWKRLMQKLLTPFAMIFAMAFVISCGSTRVVFIHQSSDVVRMGPEVRGKVYFLRDGKWVLSQNKVTLPEGWYAGALEGVGDRE
jgi:hypothetical protein